MSDAPLQVDNNSSLLPPVGLNQFHALLNNKFEAAFTIGRAINYINFIDNRGGALGDLVDCIQWKTIADSLQKSCLALELIDEQRLIIQAAIAQLYPSLIPTDDAMENSQYRAELVGVWLEDSQATEPLDTRLSLLESKSANPLKNLLDTITSPPSTLSEWIFLGLEIDRIFRPLGLAGRIRKERNADNVFEFYVMNDPDFFGVEHRNTLISGAFSRVLPTHTLLIEPNSRENDQLCESMIATSIRTLCQLYAEQEGSLGFVKLWVVELKDLMIRRDSIEIVLNENDFRLVKRLIQDRLRPETVANEPFASNQTIAKIYSTGNSQTRESNSYRAEIERINKKLKPLSLNLKSVKQKRENGRRIVDLRNENNVVDAAAN